MKKIISTQLLRKLIKIQLLENYKKNILLEEPQVYDKEEVKKYFDSIQAGNSTEQTTTPPPTPQLTLTPTKKELNYYDDYEEYRGGKLEDLKIKLTEPILNKESYRKIIDDLFTKSQYQNVRKYLKIPPYYIITTIVIPPNATPFNKDQRHRYKMLFDREEDTKNQIIDQLDTLFQSKQIPAGYTIIFPMKYIKRKIVNSIVNDNNAKDQIDTEIDTAFKKINFKNLLNKNDIQITEDSFNALPSYNNVIANTPKVKTPTGTVVKKRKETTGTETSISKPVDKPESEIWKGIAAGSTNLKTCFEELNLVDKINYDTSKKEFKINITFTDEQKKALKKISMPNQIINKGIIIDSSKDASKIYVDGTENTIINESQLKILFKNAIQNKKIITIGGPTRTAGVITFNFVR